LASAGGTTLWTGSDTGVAAGAGRGTLATAGAAGVTVWKGRVIAPGAGAPAGAARGRETGASSGGASGTGSGEESAASAKPVNGITRKRSEFAMPCASVTPRIELVRKTIQEKKIPTPKTKVTSIADLYPVWRTANITEI